MLNLTASDHDELEACAGQLRADGWAAFVTFDHLLASWRRLATEVASYPATVDDYTNDLTSRKGLELLLRGCSNPVAERLTEVLRPVDDQFLNGTDADETGVLALFYRVDENSGWWLRRIPKDGSLRLYLDDAWDRRESRT